MKPGILKLCLMAVIPLGLTGCNLSLTLDQNGNVTAGVSGTIPSKFRGDGKSVVKLDRSFARQK